MANKEINVNGIGVHYKKIDKEDYVSLTDLARYANPSEPKIPIATWMRNKDVISYLGLWEKLHNPDFKGHEFETFESAAGKHSFYLSPQKWIETTNAIGIISKSGNNGGTFAHRDIAFEFASWLSPEFKLYLVTEFQRLKSQEQQALEWSAKRELAKINYRIHTDAIIEFVRSHISNVYLIHLFSPYLTLSKSSKCIISKSGPYSKYSPSSSSNRSNSCTLILPAQVIAIVAILLSSSTSMILSLWKYSPSKYSYS